MLKISIPKVYRKTAKRQSTLFLPYANCAEGRFPGSMGGMDRKISIFAAVIILGATLLFFAVLRPAQDVIRVDNPRPNQSIETPLFVAGQARGTWYFEADFPVKLFDGNDFLLGITPAHALGEWMTENFVPFSATLPFAVPSTSKGRLVLEKDNPSGLPEYADELIIPVYFKEAREIPEDVMTVKIFLSDSRFVGEPYFDCSRTAAVERQVPKTLAVAKAAAEALLRGATQEEMNQGLVSNINSGVRIQKIIIENETAKVDFDEQLEYQVGGSCRVAAIRAQITETLRQFPTVDSVVISINGRTEDILQP